MRFSSMGTNHLEDSKRCSLCVCMCVHWNIETLKRACSFGGTMVWVSLRLRFKHLHCQLKSHWNDFLRLYIYFLFSFVIGDLFFFCSSFCQCQDFRYVTQYWLFRSPIEPQLNQYYYIISEPNWKCVWLRRKASLCCRGSALRAKQQKTQPETTQTATLSHAQFPALLP